MREGRRIHNHPLSLIILSKFNGEYYDECSYIIQKWQNKCEKRHPFPLRDTADKSRKNSQNTSPVAGGYLVGGPG
jgi:hypothetical protein